MARSASKQRRKVLSEEEYTATLTSIVQRDYFPDLPDLERQAAVLERRAQGDVVGAVAVRRAARRLQQHEEALSAMEKEDEHDLDDNHVGPVRKKARPLHEEDITGFHTRATNEDDEDFDSNQKKEIKENRERLENLFRVPNSDAALPLLTSMASDQFQAEPNRIAAIEWNKPSVRNGLFFVPTPLRNEDQSSAESVKRITNGPAVAASSEQSQLALMPPPARGAVKQSAAPLKHELVEYVPKHALEKRIEPSRTRFSNKVIPFPTNVGRGLVAASDLESETDGSVTDASTDLDAPLRPVDEERRRERRRNERNHQSYVAMTPLIVPGTTGNESPIMTWGAVDSTPLILSGQEADQGGKGSSYSMASENGRDRAARKAEEALARRAKRAKTTRPASFYRGNSDSLAGPGTAGLSAAALSLWQRKNQKSPPRPTDAFASSLRSSYTPKVQSKSGSTSSARRTVDNAFNATPLASRSHKSK